MWFGERPAVIGEPLATIVQFFEAIMARRAKGLQLAGQERAPVAAMRFDMVCDRCRGRNAFNAAKRATDCCARAASGQTDDDTAAPPMSVRTTPRLISHSVKWALQLESRIGSACALRRP
jgi:hypothetical protein